MSFDNCVEDQREKYINITNNQNNTFKCIEYTPCGARSCIDIEKKKIYSCRDQISTCMGGYVIKEPKDGDAYVWICDYTDSGY